MKKILTVAGAVSLLALAACGGDSEAEVNNVAIDELAVPADENLLVDDTLADQANALDTTNGTADANLAADANASTDANSVDANAIGNDTNAQ